MWDLKDKSLQALMVKSMKKLWWKVDSLISETTQTSAKNANMAQDW